MSDLKERATAILKEFKGDRYAFGSGVLDEAPGKFAAQFGKKALVIGSTASGWFQPIMGRILKSLESAGLEVVGTVKSAAPNAPFVDVYRIHSHIVHKNPDVIVAAAGGSGIDAAKAAATLATLGDHQPEIDPFFRGRRGYKDVPGSGTFDQTGGGRYDGVQFRGPFDQIFQHYRSRCGSKEIDRGRSHRSSPGRL